MEGAKYPLFEFAPHFVELFAGAYPALKNLQLKEPLQSVFNLNIEKGAASAVGKVFKACSWTENKQDLLFDFERKERKGKLVIQEALHEERVQLDLSFEKEARLRRSQGLLQDLPSI